MVNLNGQNHSQEICFSPGCRRGSMLTSLTKHLSEVGGMSPDGGANLQDFQTQCSCVRGKSLGNVALKATEHKGRTKGFPAMVSVLPFNRLSWKGSSSSISLHVAFLFQKFLKASVLLHQELNRVVNYFPSQIHSYSSEALFG